MYLGWQYYAQQRGRPSKGLTLPCRPLLFWSHSRTVLPSPFSWLICARCGRGTAEEQSLAGHTALAASRPGTWREREDKLTPPICPGKRKPNVHRSATSKAGPPPASLLPHDASLDLGYCLPGLVMIRLEKSKRLLLIFRRVPTSSSNSVTWIFSCSWSPIRFCKERADVKAGLKPLPHLCPEKPPGTPHSRAVLGVQQPSQGWKSFRYLGLLFL